MSEAKNEILVYQPNETKRLEVRLENEVLQNPTVANFATVQQGRQRGRPFRI